MKTPLSPVYYPQKTIIQNHSMGREIISKMGMPSKMMILSFAFGILCSVGFMWQFILISELYFGHDVTSSVFMTLPEELEAPGLTTCYRYMEILDFDQLNKDTGLNIRYSDTDEHFWDLQRILTLGQIFKYTPPTDKAIERCRYRTPHSFIIEERFGKDCYELFTVRKFFVLEYVCYQYEYQAVRKKLFSYEEVTSAPVSPGLMYKIYPGPLFHKYRLAKFMVTEPGVYPYQSVKFTPELDRNSEDAHDSNRTLFRYTMAYHVSEQHRLPPPFETMCYNYSLVEKRVTETQIDCHQMCVMDRTLPLLKLVAFSSIAIPARKDEQDLLVMGYHDIQDGRTVTQLVQYYNECILECPRRDCHDVMVFTELTFEPNWRLSFKIMAPNEQWVYVAFKPLIDFTEYMSLSLGCIGTWFGLSALSFNPFHFWMRRERKKQKMNISGYLKSHEKIRKELQALQIEIVALKSPQKFSFSRKISAAQHHHY